MSQTGVGDAWCARKRSHSRRKLYLAEMEKVIPRRSLQDLLELFYPVAGTYICWKRRCECITYRTTVLVERLDDARDYAGGRVCAAFAYETHPG